MPPQLALLLWFVLLLALFHIERQRGRNVSVALWIPVMWMFITASRLPSQWLGTSVAYSIASQAEGNALDRTVYLILIAAAVAVLAMRSFDITRFAVMNAILLALLTYALASVSWSDYPAISFKRWVRDLGIYLAVLVVLTERDPKRAVEELIRRLAILLVPLSIVANKYFPEFAWQYDQWTGDRYYSGVATSKNMLGVLSMVSALYFYWDTLTIWLARKRRDVKRTLAINCGLLALSAWVLVQSNSATSTLCAAIGGLIITASHVGLFRRHPRALLILIPTVIGTYALLQFVLDVNIVTNVAQLFGRSPDLTGRTTIWAVVLGLAENPLIGAGYEAFWLGHRLPAIWGKVGRINVAHNGYLETYLTLGAIGLAIMIAFLAFGYMTITRRFIVDPVHASLGLSLWAVLLFYNVTESSLRGNVLWVIYLLFVIRIPEPRVRRPTRNRPHRLDKGIPFRIESRYTNQGVGVRNRLT